MSKKSIWAFYGDVMDVLSEAIKEAEDKARWDRLEEAYEAQLDERAAGKSWSGNLGNG